LDDREERIRLTRDIYVPPPDDPGLGRLEVALDKVMAGAPAAAALKAAIKAGKVSRDPEDTLLERAVEKGIIDEAAAKRIREAEKARDDAIQVDEFDPAMFGRGRSTPVAAGRAEASAPPAVPGVGPSERATSRPS